MEILDSIESIEGVIKDNGMVLVYFGNTTWGVCVDLKSKVLTLLEDYPEIRLIYVDSDKSQKLAINYNIFTIPGILIFVDGKESIREARHISIGELDNRIARYYNLLFN